jgi:glycosyltransferase involved in cell wall biosynthesis
MSLVAALRAQTLLPAQVIVVVDHDPDLLARLRESMRGVAIVPNSYTRGLSGARNSGVDHATGGVVAFIDDDALPAHDLLERLAAGYQDEAVLGVGGAVDPAWEVRAPGWFPPEFDWVVGCSYTGMPRMPSSIRNFIGCNMSFRRDVFDSVGGFQIELGRIGSKPFGCEETEFCIRLSAAFPSGVLLFEPMARVRHSVPVERSTWKYFRSRCYSEGRSKALVSYLRGASRGLASERSYVASTLPRGVLEGVSLWLHGDRAGLARAGAILVGLAVTSVGYVAGRLELVTTHRAAQLREATAVTDRLRGHVVTARSNGSAADEGHA